MNEQIDALLTALFASSAWVDASATQDREAQRELVRGVMLAAAGAERKRIAAEIEQIKGFAGPREIADIVRHSSTQE